MSFSARYEWLDPGSGESTGTFRARQRADGQQVQVHVRSRADDRLRRELEELSPEKRALVLFEDEKDGMVYVVTSALPGGMGFEQWLRAPKAANPEDLLHKKGKWDTTGFNLAQMPLKQAEPAGASATGPFAASSEPVRGEAGEFTRMFMAPGPASGPSPEGSSQAKPEASEFTRMFQAPSTPAPPAVEPPVPLPAAPAAAPPPQPAAQAPAPSKADAGEFTRMFQGPKAIPLSEEPTQALRPPVFPRVSGGDEPTQEFLHPADSFRKFTPAPVTNREPPTEPMAGPPRPSPAAPTGPGEFTRMFEAGRETAPPVAPTKTGPASTAPSTTPPAASPRNDPGEFTRMFQPARPAAPAGETIPTQPMQSPAKPAQAAPGEFTSMFNPPAALSGGAPPVQRTGQPAPPQGQFGRMVQPGTGAPPPLGSGPAQSSGDFTRMFGKPGLPADVAPPRPTPPQPPMQQRPPAMPQPPVQSAPGEFTRMFDRPVMPAGGPPPTQPPQPGMPYPQMQPPPAPQMPPPGVQYPQMQPPAVQFQQPQFQPPQFQGPQMQAPQMQPPQMQAPQMQAPQMQYQPPQFQAPQYQPPPMPAPPIAAAAPRPTNYLPLVLILAGLLVVALILVIYFARR